MARPPVPDDAWAAIRQPLAPAPPDAAPAPPRLPAAVGAAIAPLLPPARPKPKGGRPPIPDRAALTGILFVLKTGLPWEYLPAEMGCGSGMSCWRRLRDWHEAGVWAALHRALLERLPAAGPAGWARAAPARAT